MQLFQEVAFYGLEGTISWTIDGEIRSGDTVWIPRGVVPGFDNRGEVDAKRLCIASPAVFGPSYFREIGQVLAASRGGPRTEAPYGCHATPRTHTRSAHHVLATF